MIDKEYLEILNTVEPKEEHRADQGSKPKTISRKALISLTSSYFSLFFSKGCGAITKIILARLIVPAYWGIFAEALLVLTLAETVRDLGISSHLVREEDPPYGNALIIQVLVALFFLLLIQIVAPYFAFLDSHVPNVLRVLFLAGVIQAFTATPETFIHKELLLQLKIMPSALRNLAFSVITIIMAWNGMGIWSLILGHIASNFLYTIALWIKVSPRINLKLTLSETGKLIASSKYLLFMAILGVVGSQIDFGVVGALLSAQKAGYYFIAFNLVLYPTVTIESAIHNVIYPAFAHYQQDKIRLGELYQLATSIVMALEVPIYAFIFFSAPTLVELFLGRNWLPVVPLVRILSFLPIIDPFSMFGQSLLKAIKKDKMLSIAQVIGTVVLVISSITFTKMFGLFGTAIARYMIFGNLLIILSVQQSIRKYFSNLVGRLVIIYGSSFATIGALFLVGTNYSSPIAGLVISLLGVCLCWIVYYHLFFASTINMKQFILSKA